MTNNHVAQALLRDKFLINLNNLVSSPARTGIQRVCYEFCSRWPHLEDTIPFVELGMDRIGILDPGFFENVRQLFEDTDDVLQALSAEFGDIRIDTSPGVIGLLSARNRIILEVSVTEALEHCRAILSLEESLNLEFFSLAAATRPEKIFNLCHDFLSWTHSEYFPTDWKSADNICLSLTNRRKYTHNIFTSTATRDVFVNRINRGDRRPYLVIPPGADGLGRIFRKHVPQSTEFLVVGTLEPRKQTVPILRAFEQLQAEGHDARLCFAGKMGWLDEADKAELESAFSRYSWLRWIDGPSDDELRSLMMNCRATIYMSVAEGFGSPPVESLALGVPCIVSANLPSVRDMESNGQLRVDPDDHAGLVEAIRRLLDHDTVAGLQKEIETLQLPTWQAFVDGIAGLVEQNAPALYDHNHSSSYRARLEVLTSLSLMRQLDRPALVERLARIGNPELTDRELVRWQILAERSGWSNVEVALNLMTAFPHAIPAALVHEAVARNLDVEYVPTKFAKEWQSRFRRLMQIPSFPAFYEAIYVNILERTPGRRELETHMPRDERQDLRTSHLRAAINSDEYRERIASTVRYKFAEGYLDTVSLPTIAWKNRILDQLMNEAAVDRALLIDDDDDFLEIASLDLMGQLPSRDTRSKSKTVLRSRNGREKILLRMLLSEACLRRVKEPDAHLELIHRLASQAGLTKRRSTNAQALPGKVNAVLTLREDQLAKGFEIFFGRPQTPEEQALSELGTNDNGHMLAARFVLYGTLLGDLDMSPLFVSWAANTIISCRPSSCELKPVTSNVTIETLFEALFLRAPQARETAILTEAAKSGLTDGAIADSVRVAAIRKGVIDDHLGQITYFAQEHLRLTADFDRIDALAEKLLAAAPENRATPWRRPKPSVDNEDGSAVSTPDTKDEGKFLLRHQADANIVTVDQLMAEEGSDFVRAAYRNLLLREADEDGLQTYVNALRAGRSKASVIYSLSVSSEGRAADVNLIGLDELLARQRKMRRWPIRKFLQIAGIPL